MTDRRDRIRLEDPHGHPLAVNKVGNLTRVFAETDDAARAEILAGHRAGARRPARRTAGVEAYLNYGCLLGAVREGRMIGTDCDADVCYLSEQTHPADVILESYALERAMLDRGWPTVRMSGGDFKVLLRLADGRTVYVDVFVAFYVDGVFYQLGNRSGSPAAGGDRARLDDRARGRAAARRRPTPRRCWRSSTARLAGARTPSFQLHRPAGRGAPPRRLAARLPRRAAGLERVLPQPARRRRARRRRSDFAALGSLAGSRAATRSSELGSRHRP